MFLGETDLASQRSGLTGVHYDNDNINDINDNYYHDRNYNDNDIATYGGGIARDRINPQPYGRSGHDGAYAVAVGHASSALAPHGQMTPPDDFPIGHETLMRSHGAWEHVRGISAWLEIWDYAGGSSFRAFVAQDPHDEEEKSMFVFFDSHVVSRDLKRALVALIELAEGPLTCSRLVICLDRRIPEEEATAVIRGLQWAGFSLTTLDFWSGGLDDVSNQWLFMGMEV